MLQGTVLVASAMSGEPQQTITDSSSRLKWNAMRRSMLGSSLSFLQQSEHSIRDMAQGFNSMHI